MLPIWRDKQLWRSHWVKKARESRLNDGTIWVPLINQGTKSLHFRDQRKEQSARKGPVSTQAPPHQVDWHTSASWNSKDKTVFGFVTPLVFCRQVWFSLSIDSVIKSGPLLSLRQAIRLDTLPLRTGMPKCYMGDSNLLVGAPVNLPTWVRNCCSLCYVILHMPCPPIPILGVYWKKKEGKTALAGRYEEP